MAITWKQNFKGGDSSLTLVMKGMKNTDMRDRDPSSGGWRTRDKKDEKTKTWKREIPRFRSG
jgi:hypothetical protein